MRRHSLLVIVIGVALMVTAPLVSASEEDTEVDSDIDLDIDLDMETDIDNEFDTEIDTESDADTESTVTTDVEAHSAMEVDAVEQQMIIAALSDNEKPKDWFTFFHRHILPNPIMAPNGGYVKEGALVEKSTGKILAKTVGWDASEEEMKALLTGLSNVNSLRSNPGFLKIDDIKYKIRTATKRMPNHVLGSVSKKDGGDNGGQQLFATSTNTLVIIETSTPGKPAHWWTERARKMASYLMMRDM